MPSATDYLQSLITIPSVNPMSGALDGDIYYEHRLTDYLQSQFEKLQVQWARQRVHPQRDNILAIAPCPDPDAPTLMWEVHQDTVRVDRMTIDPFGAEVKNGKMYGRGACDVKAGMAAMLAAFEKLIAEPERQKVNVILACTINEEFGFTGAEKLLAAFTDGSIPFMQKQPDACIVAEPTKLNVVIGHNGTVRWEVVAHGVTAHTSAPWLGENAIFAMAGVIAAIEKYAAEEIEKFQVEGFPPPAISAGPIHGGEAVNVVPDRCTLVVDRRLVSTEDPLVARQAVIDYITAHLPAGKVDAIEHEPPFIDALPLADQSASEIATSLSEIAKTRGGGKQTRVAYGTDASVLAQHGMPTVVFGPGSIEQAHTKDEWVELAQVETAAEILLELATH